MSPLCLALLQINSANCETRERKSDNGKFSRLPFTLLLCRNRVQVDFYYMFMTEWKIREIEQQRVNQHVVQKQLLTFD
jgi:hypothetical protein